MDGTEETIQSILPTDLSARIYRRVRFDGPFLHTVALTGPTPRLVCPFHSRLRLVVHGRNLRRIIPTALIVLVVVDGCTR